MKLFENIKLSCNENETDLINKISKTYKINKNDILSYKILKRSIDARKEPMFIYKVGLTLKGDNYNKFPDYIEEELVIPKTNNKMNICVIGFGPSSIFASLILTLKGHNVTVFEKGDNVDSRVLKVENFITNSELDESTNIQFGEGGAGTFSDGKLNTRTKSPYNKFVLDTFVKFGADESIAYSHNPHIGTDVLRIVIKNIREYLISNGCKVNFLSEVTKFNIKKSQIESVVVNDKTETFDKYILGLGNASRDTFKELYLKGVEMESKSIACGFRVEHIQENININQYKEHFNNVNLGASEYKLTSKDNDCYTFCMCPGGEVVNATSKKGQSLTNGMSNFARDGKNANSAVIVKVEKTKEVLGLIDFQEEIERKCFELTGNYQLPAMNIKDFVNKKTTSSLVIDSSVRSGIVIKDLSNIYPEYINEAVRKSLVEFDKKIKGFLNGIIIGVETRSSSPVRIIRNDNYQSNILNLYPIGEGAGYAGGITSSAIDGVRVAISIK